MVENPFGTRTARKEARLPGTRCRLLSNASPSKQVKELHHEFVENGVIGNPLRATAEKGHEAFRRYSEHVAKGVMELMTVPVKVHTREFVDRVM